MILDENIESVYSAGREMQKVYSYGKLVWEKKDYRQIPFTVKAIGDKVSISIYTSEPIVRLYYSFSINGGEWKRTSGTININKNDTISFLADKAYDVQISGLSDVYGNVMSLLHGDDFINQSSWMWYSQIYSGLFSNCDIRSAKNLFLPPPDGEYCCNNMFANCMYLTTPPKLPATTLYNGCYKGMFFNCSSLTTAPELPATTLYRRCYYEMFRGCSSLNYIKCYAMQNISNDSVGNWLKNTSGGTFVCYSDSNIQNYIPDTWTVEYLT